MLGPDVDRARILDAESFWARRDELANPDQALEVAVAGDGGSAGTIVAWLAQRFAETGSRVFSISPLGTLFPRGDGHAERRWFTDPSDWKRLTIPHRKKIIDRTEAGVISMRNKRVIDSSTLIDYFVGYVDSVSSDADQKLQIKTIYDGVPGQPVGADYLINAIGFDSWTRLNLIDHPAAQGLAKLRSPMNQATLDAARSNVERTIEHDLSLPASAGFPPRLHIPALAGLAHGPGISNLGCLGVMAQLVLQTYEK